MEGMMKITDEEKTRLQADTGIPHPPTDLTYECRMAMSGEGPRAYDWSDKPHRLVFDLCREIERLAALSASPAGVVKPLEIVPTDRLERLIGTGDPTSEEAHDMAVEILNHRQAARIMSAIEPAGVGVETEWKAAWIARGTVVAFPGGCFDVGDCPDPEQLAIFIAEAVNAYRRRASLKGDEQ